MAKRGGAAKTLAEVFAGDTAGREIDLESLRLPQGWAPPAPDARATVLRDALEHVTAGRNLTYGEPEDNFRRIAALWRVYLRDQGERAAEVEAGDVALLMILMKVARLMASPSHRDSWVDLAGYAACGAAVCPEGLGRDEGF